MPADDVANGVVSLNQHTARTALANPSVESKGDMSNATVAEKRLRQEVREMRRVPTYSLRGTRDITADFISASSQLPPGELVKDEYFTLFEAVGAIEIMDPKMDSGCIPPGDSFEPDFDVCRGLSATQILWIMDELLCLEMSFHDGFPLSQNIYKSLHIMRLVHPDNKQPYHFRFEESHLNHSSPTTEEKLVHIVLRAYCIALLKSIQLALNIIQSYTFYEEEDFVTYLFGRELLPKLRDQEALAIIHEAKDWLAVSGLPKDSKDALEQRLFIREHLIFSLDSYDERPWVRLNNELELMDTHHHLAEALPDAFSDKVQRQLATSTPPRPMPKTSWQEGCRKWRQICEDVLAIFRLTSLRVRESPHCQQRASWAFAYRQPAPNTFARAKMQEVLTREESVAGETPHFDLMLSDIRDLVLAGDPLADTASFLIEVPTDPRHRASRVIEDFMQKAFGEYINLYRMACQNRCRMRRTYTQAAPIWDEIETEAREADRQLNQIIVPRRVEDAPGVWLQLEPLIIWSRNHKLQLMEWIVQLGFETDLHLPREMCTMYMTLEKISRSRRQLLLQLQRFVEDRLSNLRRASDREYQEQCRASQTWIKSLVLHSTTMEHMAGALCDVYALLESLSIIDTERKLYAQEDLQYEARMKPLLGFANDHTIPDLNDIHERKKMASANAVPTCTKVVASFKQARAQLAELKSMNPTQAKYVGTEEQWKKEIKALETVCVAASVAVSQLQGICEKHSDQQSLKDIVELVIPPPGKRYHDWWAVPQFREKKK